MCEDNCFMKQLTVISGKGGTGKTTITSAFAHLAHNSVLADSDVDAADLHLVLAPHIEHREPYFGEIMQMIRRPCC